MLVIKVNFLVIFWKKFAKSMKKMAHIVIKSGQFCHFPYIIAHKSRKSYETMTKNAKIFLFFVFFVFCFFVFCFFDLQKICDFVASFFEKIIFLIFCKIKFWENISPLWGGSVRALHPRWRWPPQVSGLSARGVC